MQQANVNFQLFVNGALIGSERGHLHGRWVRGQRTNEGERTFVFTHELEVPLSSQIRDDWPTAPDGSELVVIDGVQYWIVFVERERKGRGDSFLRAYLNRRGLVSITVREQDLSPSVTSVTIVTVHQDDGFTVTDQGGGEVLIRQSDAAASSAGKVAAGNQTLTGRKTFIATASEARPLAVDVNGQPSVGIALGLDDDPTTPIVVAEIGVFHTSSGSDARYNVSLQAGFEENSPRESWILIDAHEHYCLLDTNRSGNQIHFAVREDGGSVKTGATGSDGVNTFVGGIATTIGSAAGEANTASNVGGETEIFKQKTGVDLELRTLKAGTNVTLTENANDIEIAASGGGATTFTGLTDTPSNYSGSGGHVVRVNSGASALEFVSGANTGTVQPGTIAMYGGGTVPAGYFECDGSAVSRTTYADLFSAIGTTWGSGDGSTTFNLPDFRSRSPIGAGQGSGLTNRALAATGGAETHQLTVSELPAHDHNKGIQIGAWGTTSGANIFSVGGAGGGSTGSTGSDAAHNNVHPFAAVKFIIKT